MDVQSVFDKVIVAGVYADLCKDGYELMCFALKDAARKGLITREEFILAKNEIREYLGGFGSLGGMLNYRDQPWDFATRLAIYKDWSNRPTWK